MKRKKEEKIIQFSIEWEKGLNYKVIVNEKLMLLCLEKYVNDMLDKWEHTIEYLLE